MGCLCHGKCAGSDRRSGILVYRVCNFRCNENQGAYKNEKLDQLEEQLSQEFDPDKRAKLAVQMQQTVLDDNAFVYCSFLKMSQISRANVTGYMAHACDYYQVTADLDIN